MRTTDPAEPSVTCPSHYLDHVLSTRRVALPPIPSTCIIAYCERLLTYVTTAYRHTMVDIGLTVPTQLYFLDAEDGSRFSILRGYAGAPMAAVLLEELIALGFRRFVALGAAGHPTNGDGPTIPIGGIVLASEAFIYEGTSSHYRPSAAVSYPTDASLQALSQSLSNERIEHRIGAVATTDALYRETPSFVAEVVKRRVVAIDMELSALFTVATFHGVEMAGLLYISDIVDGNGHWHLGIGETQARGLDQRLHPLLARYARQDETR